MRVSPVDVSAENGGGAADVANGEGAGRPHEGRAARIGNTRIREDEPIESAGAEPVVAEPAPTGGQEGDGPQATPGLGVVTRVGDDGFGGAPSSVTATAPSQRVSSTVKGPAGLAGPGVPQGVHHRFVHREERLVEQRAAVEKHRGQPAGGTRLDELAGKGAPPALCGGGDGRRTRSRAAHAAPCSFRVLTRGAGFSAPQWPCTSASSLRRPHGRTPPEAGALRTQVASVATRTCGCIG